MSDKVGRRKPLFYFLTFTDSGDLQYQGVIDERMPGGMVRGHLCSWIDGEPNGEVVYDAASMTRENGFELFFSIDEWRWEGTRITASRWGGLRNARLTYEASFGKPPPGYDRMDPRHG